MAIKVKPIYNWDDVPILFDMALACRIFGVFYETIKSWTKTKRYASLSCRQ